MVLSLNYFMYERMHCNRVHFESIGMFKLAIIPFSVKTNAISCCCFGFRIQFFLRFCSLTYLEIVGCSSFQSSFDFYLFFSLVYSYSFFFCFCITWCCLVSIIRPNEEWKSCTIVNKCKHFSSLAIKWPPTPCICNKISKKKNQRSHVFNTTQR